MHVAANSNISGCITQEGQIYTWGLVCHQTSEKVLYKLPTRVMLPALPFPGASPQVKSSFPISKRKGAIHSQGNSPAGRAVELKLGEAFALALCENV